VLKLLSSFLGFLKRAGCLFLTVSGGDLLWFFIDFDRDGLFELSVAKIKGSFGSKMETSSID